MAWALLATLERHGLAWSAGAYHTPHQYEITPYGEWFLNRLADPE